jgi:hypothetical protein
MPPSNAKHHFGGQVVGEIRWKQLGCLRWDALPERLGWKNDDPPGALGLPCFMLRLVLHPQKSMVRKPLLGVMLSHGEISVVIEMRDT